MMCVLIPHSSFRYAYVPFLSLCWNMTGASTSSEGNVPGVLPHSDRVLSVLLVLESFCGPLPDPIERMRRKAH
jgi:hypothetical protein